jgi:hypothetical protein
MQRNLMNDKVSWLRYQPRRGLALLFFDSLGLELMDDESRQSLVKVLAEESYDGIASLASS